MKKGKPQKPRKCVICAQPLPRDMEENFEKQTIVNVSGVNPVPCPPLTYNVLDDKNKVINKKWLCINCASIAFMKLNELLQSGAIKIMQAPPDPRGLGIVKPS